MSGLAATVYYEHYHIIKMAFYNLLDHISSQKHLLKKNIKKTASPEAVYNKQTKSTIVV